MLRLNTRGMLKPRALTEVLGQVNTPDTKGAALLLNREGELLLPNFRFKTNFAELLACIYLDLLWKEV